MSNTFLSQSDFKKTVHHTDKLRVAAYLKYRKRILRRHSAVIIIGHPLECSPITASQEHKRKTEQVLTV